MRKSKRVFRFNGRAPWGWKAEGSLHPLLSFSLEVGRREVFISFAFVGFSVEFWTYPTTLFDVD